MTQIQLEHIRKLTFIPDKQTSGIMGRPPLMMGEIEKPAGKELPMPASHEFGSKPLPHIHFKKKPFHSPKEICGTIDRSVNFHLPSHARSLNDRKKSSLKSASSVGGLAGNDDDEFNAADVSHSPTFASLSDYDSDDIDFEKEENHSQSQSQSQSPVEQTAADTTLFMDNGNASAGVVTLPSITRGAWPWLAAIYVNNLTSLDYQCGGTLVSTRVVISSAHCFQMFNKRYTANEVLVFLGRHNLKNWNEEGSLAAPVDGIYIHPDYNSQLSTYDADIAVILLKDEVRFNTFIRPVCLWSGSSKSEYIVGEHGIVIGWSFNRMNISGSSHKHSTASKSGAGAGAGAISENSSTPKVVEAPIVSNEECFKANAHFRSLSSNRTFCASILLESKLHIPRGKGSSRSSACQRFENSGLYTGISGAGLMIHKNQRWMLRGTVSAALPPVNGTDTANKAHQCNRHKYLIYTDVAKFIDWIMAFII
ncbi:serine protease gd isoform X2 [Scaptodrosophila lebanonensis]|nr:serine protease gd isoform X2 [Scaptodrosophila lebanonensis]